MSAEEGMQAEPVLALFARALSIQLLLHPVTRFQIIIKINNYKQV